jgi:hypothetical protein
MTPPADDAVSALGVAIMAASAAGLLFSQFQGSRPKSNDTVAK